MLTLINNIFRLVFVTCGVPMLLLALTATLIWLAINRAPKDQGRKRQDIDAMSYAILRDINKR